MSLLAANMALLGIEMMLWDAYTTLWDINKMPLGADMKVTEADAGLLMPDDCLGGGLKQRWLLMRDEQVPMGG